jgi:hypothetical protein
MSHAKSSNVTDAAEKMALQAQLEALIHKLIHKVDYDLLR